MIFFDSELFPQNFVWSSIMIKKASIYTMNALYKSIEVWHTSVNCKARPDKVILTITSAMQGMSHSNVTFVATTVFKILCEAQ